MAGKIQNEDIKSVAELTAAGGSANQLPNADKIWVATLGKTLAQAITDGDIGGGGGGGSSLEWNEDDAYLAPLKLQDNLFQVRVMSAGQAQYLFAVVKVPSTYVAGSQISFRCGFYSASNSGNVQLRTITYLFRTGMDAVTGTPGSYASSTSNTLSSGTVSKIQALTFNLTDASGQIGGVAVSAGDTLRVSFLRLSDTSTGDAYCLIDSGELKFK